jgi:hypothetical protein
MLDGWLNSTYTGEFEKESVFVSAIFSNLISYLYSLQLSIAWYSIILMSITLVALTHWLTISTLENIIKKRYILIIINSSAAVIFLLWSYIGITFTSTAIICAVAGLYSLIKSQIEINNSKLINDLLFFLNTKLINQNFSKNTIFYAIQGTKRSWQMQCNKRSQHYTTNIKELVKVY